MGEAKATALRWASLLWRLRTRLSLSAPVSDQAQGHVHRTVDMLVGPEKSAVPSWPLSALRSPSPQAGRVVSLSGVRQTARLAEASGQLLPFGHLLRKAAPGSHMRGSQSHHPGCTKSSTERRTDLKHGMQQGLLRGRGRPDPGSVPRALRVSGQRPPHVESRATLRVRQELELESGVCALEESRPS